MMIRLTSNLFVSSLILQFPLICTAQPSLGMQNMSDYGDVSVMCGLYSVLAAAEALDRIDAENMIFSADFVGKPGGSTAADLLACLQSVGLEGRYLYGIDILSLIEFNSPIVIQTRVISNPGQYHWVTFLGKSATGFSVYNAPQGLETWSKERIVSVFTGAGVVVWRAGEKAPEFTSAGIRISVRRMCWLVPPFIFAFGCTVFSARFFPRSTTSNPTNPHDRCVTAMLIQILSISVFVLSWSFLLHLKQPERRQLVGLLNRYDCWNHSREVGFTRDLSRLATDIVIDCRSPVDYRNEHVDGAINIPITTGIYELEQRLSANRKRFRETRFGVLPKRGL